MNVARPSIRAFGLRQEILKTLQCKFAAFRKPAKQSCLGKAVDLPRLYANPSGTKIIRRPVDIETFYKASPRLIPALARPQWQRMIYHMRFETLDDIHWIRCRVSIPHACPPLLYLQEMSKLPRVASTGTLRSRVLL